jgi:hypothetical protein
MVAVAESHPPMAEYCVTRVCTQFLLEIDELAGLSQRLEPWRQDVYAPLIIEVGAAGFGSGAGACERT